MLKILRKKGVMKRLLWVVAIVIIISFGFFGRANYLNRRGAADYAGKIFGRKIPMTQFRQSLLHTRTQSIMRYGKNFYKISQFLDLEKQAWDRLILLYEGKKRNIKVSDESIRETIAGLPFFQDKGQFSSALYTKIVPYVFQCSPRQFEEGVRQSLIFEKIFDQETAFINVSEEEARKAYQKQNEEVQVDYVVFSSKDYMEGISIDPDKAKKYYDENKNDFLIPPTINVEFLFLEFPKNMTDEQKTPLTEKIAAISQDLVQTPDLKAIAKKYDLPLKESGYFSYEQPNLSLGWSYELLQNVFSLKKEEITPPLETSKGYYILTVKDRKDSQIPNYNTVQQKVLDALKENAAKKIAEKKANEYLEKLKTALTDNPEKGFAEYIKESSLSLKQTAPFKRGQYLPDIGISKDFQDAAFALKANQRISPVIEIAKGCCILHLNSFKQIDEKKFSEERDAFSQSILQQKKSEAFAEFINRLRVKANLENNLAKPNKTRP